VAKKPSRKKRPAPSTRSAQPAPAPKEPGVIQIITLDGDSYLVAKLSDKVPPGYPYDVDVIIRSDQNSGAHGCVLECVKCGCLGEVNCDTLIPPG
jgi:hypothetical protein